MDPGPAFVLQPPGSENSARWTVGPPRDPDGDGVLTFTSELHDDGLTAVTEVQVDGVTGDGRAVRLPTFVEDLAGCWRGWDGVREWRSLDHELLLDARHDGRGHVALGVALRRYRTTVDETRWSARAVFHLEAGEETARLAADLAAALAG